jgi:predicted PurR-regulated permease PerM
MSDTAPSPAPKYWRQRRPPRWLPRATLVVALVWLAVNVSWGIITQLKSLLVILLAALFVAFAIEPGVDALARRGIRRGLGTGLIYLAVLLAFVGFGVLTGGLIIDQIAQLARSLPDIVSSLASFLHDKLHLNIQTELDKLKNNVGEIGGAVATNALGVGATIVSSIFDLLTVALFAFYFAAEGPQFRRGVCSMLPPKRQRLVLQVWELAIAKTAGYLYSRLLLAAVSAIAHGVFFAIIGIPYAATLGIFVGLVGQFIPTVGTYIGAALPALVALSVSPSKALLVILFAILYQQVENYVLTPPLSARTMELHPAVAFGAVIVGVTLLGPVGALLALPITATVQAVVSTYVQRHELVESELLKEPMSPKQQARADEEAEANGHPPERTVDPTNGDGRVTNAVVGAVADADRQAGRDGGPVPSGEERADHGVGE